MKLVVLGLLFSLPALAHVEPGTYVGTDEEGKECSMVAGSTYFEGGERHPLRERIKIVVNGQEFIVGHPPVLNFAESVVTFNHDAFEGVLAVAKGAKALQVGMEHSEKFEGPTGFTLVTNDWTKKGPEGRSAIRCAGIRLQK